jgi:hypothetical protein
MLMVYNEKKTVHGMVDAAEPAYDDLFKAGMHCSH